MAEHDVAVLVFDLDDTLYLERDFALSGFAAVAGHLQSTRGAAGDFAQVCGRMLAGGARGDIFDQALAACGIEAEAGLVEQLVAIYRGHEPRIALAADAVHILRRLSGPSALITDGPEATQRAKIAALGLDRRIDFIVTTGTFGPGFSKPHHRAFAEVEAWSRMEGRHHAYIADNPAKDFITARARGWTTIQVMRPERIHQAPAPGPAHEAHHVVESLLELPAILPARLFSAADGAVGGSPADPLAGENHPGSAGEDRAIEPQAGIADIP